MRRKIKLAITGCMGRMGQQIIKSGKSDNDSTITALTESRLINKKINSINVSLNNEKAFKNADIIIDFTIPKCTLEVLKFASKLKKKSSYRYNWFHKKRRKYNQKVFKKDSYFESWKHEFRH